MNEKNIIIFSDTDGLHENKLTRAFEKHGYRCSRISLVDCQLNYGSGSSGLVIPGFDDCLPDAVFVRAIPAGSFEQVTFRLDILHALEECGVLVYNSARAIERTVDKGMTSFLLARAGVPSPDTWVCESKDEALEIVKRETSIGNKLVLKPLFGNCGRGLQLIDKVSSLPPLEEVSGVYYLQKQIRSIDNKGRDWRVLVIANQAIVAMERISDHWITNRARGGKCLPAVLTGEIRELAEAASLAIDMNYAGIDIIRDTDGNYLVLEVNSVPAWRGLQSVVEKDISQMLVDDLVKKRGQKKRGSE
ncbi:MAG: tetrahydromethanopterin:alpha-L-glutamate ligase [Gammaproteobacteria bacterium]|jgi:tetrahydromethanopterin:alpha-L-glutamate ligase